MLGLHLLVQEPGGERHVGRDGLPGGVEQVEGPRNAFGPDADEQLSYAPPGSIVSITDPIVSYSD